jgi:hypothetical protein
MAATPAVTVAVTSVCRVPGWLPGPWVHATVRTAGGTSRADRLEGPWHP